MPRYFFHVHNSFGVAADDEGQDVDSLAEARRIAIESIRTILSEELRNGCLDLRGRVVIADPSGAICATVPFTEAVDLKLEPDLGA